MKIEQSTKKERKKPIIIIVYMYNALPDFSVNISDRYGWNSSNKYHTDYCIDILILVTMSVVHGIGLLDEYQTFSSIHFRSSYLMFII